MVLDPELKWTIVNLISTVWMSGLCFWEEEMESLVQHRKHCFIDCTGLDWFALDRGEQDIRWKAGWEGCGQTWREVWGRWVLGYADREWVGQSGRQPSLRQHKQHADTVTGNIIIIILLFKFSLKTSKLYKKEENRFFALMKNTLFVFFPLLQRRF